MTGTWQQRHVACKQCGPACFKGCLLPRATCSLGGGERQRVGLLFTWMWAFFVENPQIILLSNSGCSCPIREHCQAGCLLRWPCVCPHPTTSQGGRLGFLTSHYWGMSWGPPKTRALKNSAVVLAGMVAFESRLLNLFCQREARLPPCISCRVLSSGDLNQLLQDWFSVQLGIPLEGTKTSSNLPHGWTHGLGLQP